MVAQDFYWMNLAPSRLTMESNLHDYDDPKMFSKKGWQVADLNQLVRNGRGRTECKDRSLMTLTTNSGKLFSKASRRVMQPLELFATHVLPVTPSQSEAAMAPMLQLDNACTTASVRMSGNAMSVPCIGAVLVATILGLS
ncbi:unnamed protein product [Durusdinium trenchii]|uniref:Uncharacterized protein n=1 Tax=Durusdinium trenchii TaxID=1381693 RepID=A0ABP0HQ51_9DINO